MSVKGCVNQVVQTSPPQTWGALWSIDYLAGLVSGGGGLNPRYVIMYFFENILLFSHKVMIIKDGREH